MTSRFAPSNATNSPQAITNPHSNKEPNTEHSKSVIMPKEKKGAPKSHSNNCIGRRCSKSYLDSVTLQVSGKLKQYPLRNKLEIIEQNDIDPRSVLSRTELNIGKVESVLSIPQDISNF